MSRNRGMSVVELLVVIAIIGVLFGISFLVLRAPVQVAAASSVRAFLTDGRIESVKRNRAVAVVPDVTGKEFQMLVNDAGGVASCSGNVTALHTLDLNDDYGNVAASTTFAGNGIVWLPSGTVRSCSGVTAAVAVVLSSSSGTRTVTLDGAGRVAVQ